MLNVVKETENFLAIKDHYGKLITDPLEKVNSLNFYYVSLFSYKSNNLLIPPKQSGKPFTISINIIWKQFSATRRKKSVRSDGIPGEILKLGEEAMIPYFARFLDIMMNSAIPSDRKKSIVVPIYKGGDRSAIGNYRYTLTSVFCKQMGT